MKINYTLIVILGGFLLWACTDKIEKKSEPPADLIAYDTMINIMIDLRLMDAALVQEQREGNAKVNDLKYFLYNSIMEKYHITREQYKTSFEYYQNDLKVIDKMFAEAITRLTKMESEIEHE
ncbi:MAG: DUF4296 domain-containing protein [Bacteroidetes bacterium]|nr:DUF4296 domain-containing protein [Bacteroidota bacterium]